ncbi:MAG: GNAT family N-acetyltransferase [Pseudomonadota bacterium]
MTLRCATPSDVQTIAACLLAQPLATVFARNNVRRHGLWTDGPASHPHQTRFWVDTDGAIALGLTNAGIVLPCHPVGADMGPLCAALRGQTVAGVIGPVQLARPLLAGLALQDRPLQLDTDEPHMRLALRDLGVPEGPGILAQGTAHRDVLIDWRLASNRETGAGAQMRDGAEREITTWIAEDRVRVLCIDDRPVAMTGFNAVLPDTVQIGGVFTPPPLRRKGYAARAVALHLAEARGAGVRTATLFAASDGAARLYDALGFAHVGHMALVLFQSPQVVP